MVSVLPSRVFAIANSDHSLREVDIGPFYPANLCLPSGINCWGLDSAYPIN
jgi:hypothetical protein